jgi:hypothetical protein
MATFVRIALGGTAKSAVYDAAAATNGVCLVTEIALVIGNNAALTNRRKFITTVNLIEAIAERHIRRKKTTATLPGATDRVMLACSITPDGFHTSPSLYARTIVAAAAAPVETNVGILIGSTVYGTSATASAPGDQSAAFYNAVKNALDCYKRNFTNKS